jgi:hypothetical protein
MEAPRRVEELLESAVDAGVVDAKGAELVRTLDAWRRGELGADELARRILTKGEDLQNPNKGK